MSEFPINRGIGKSVEFKGLKAQYLFIFVGGLLALFILFVIMYLSGVNQWLCIGRRIVSGVADLRPERQIRRTRADENASPWQPSEVHHQPA